jgi:hypothetical protein
MDLNFVFTENAFCNDVNESIAQWGPCIKDTVFLGDAAIATIFLYFVFAIVIFRSRLPPILAVPSFFILNIGIYYLDPNPVAVGGILLSAALMGIYAAYVISWKVFFK